MKLILLAGLAVLVLVIGAVAGIGAMLPKGHTASRTVRFARPAEEVWRAITDFPAQTAWRGLRKVERLPDQNGHEVWKETGAGGDALVLETVEAQPPGRLVRRIADPSLPFGGSWTYELKPETGAASPGTSLTITENGEVYNPVFRFISHFFMDQAATIEQYQAALGRKLDAR